MIVVILAGGFGSRFSEETTLRPKPMIEIGRRPILWHIMKNYAAQGYNEFIICAGYKQHMIKEYFADLYLQLSDVTFDYTRGNRETTIHGTTIEPWKVTIVDTGYSTMTAGRVQRIQNYVQGEQFMLTYGDGLADVDLKKLLAFHNASRKVVTITAARSTQRFGVLGIRDDGTVTDFREKGDGGYVNGGFMVCNPEVFNYIGGPSYDASNDDFSAVTLEKLASCGELAAYQHEGFWACMDAQRDRARLEKLWESGNAPWRIWG